MNDSKTINISTSTILRVILIILLLVFLYLIRDVIIIFLFALIIASAITPAVNLLEKIKIPRVIGTLLVYIIVIGLITLLIYLIIPTFTRDFKNLVSNFPNYLEKLSDKFESLKNTSVRYRSLIERFQNSLINFGDFLKNQSVNFLSAAFGIFGGVFSFVLIIVISFYLSVLKKGVQRTMTALIPIQYRDYLLDLWERAQKKLGRWLQGQLFLSLIIGAMVYLGLYFLGIKFALILAVLAGIFELFPYIGSVIAAVPAVILGFLQSPLLGLWVIIFYLIVHQVEGHIISPLVIGKVVGLNPIVVIIALLIGGKLGGAFGIILAVPLAAVFAEILRDLIKRRE